MGCLCIPTFTSDGFYDLRQKITMTPGELLRAAGVQLLAEFQEIRQCNPHAGDLGTEAEEILKKFLADRLPKRFGIESGIVIGQKGIISRQTDLIIYDAMNSPIYRVGKKTQIVPRDNVAVVVEVKSKLSKDQLVDAAEKIASVKCMPVRPHSGMDQPVAKSPMVNFSTLGVVFAYDAYTSLETLAENLKEINELRHSREWIDFVIVLNMGTIGYAVQLPFSNDMKGWYGGQTSYDTPSFPVYIHEVINKNENLALNEFFLRIMAHLAFFRKVMPLDFEGILGEQERSVETIQGYQFDLAGQMVPVQNSHLSGSFESPKIRYWLYHRKTKAFLGQVCYLPWQDGAVITCSTRIDPRIVYQHYFVKLRHPSATYLCTRQEINFWISSVLRVTEDAFKSKSKSIGSEIVTIFDDGSQAPKEFPGKPPASQ